MAFPNSRPTRPHLENRMGEKEVNHMERRGEPDIFENIVFSRRINSLFRQILRERITKRDSDNENGGGTVI
jgi:hypothetical protein